MCGEASRCLRSSGAGVPCSCEQPDVSAGDRNPRPLQLYPQSPSPALSRCLEGSLLCAHLRVYKSEEVREAKLLEQGILMVWRREDGSTMWALGIKPKFSGKAASALNCRVISPAPQIQLLIKK